MSPFGSYKRSLVDAFHQAALAAGGKDHGAPGLRPHYHSNYYGAFVLDPDGHNIEVVCHEAPANGRRRSKFRVQGSAFNSKLKTLDSERRLPSLGGADHNLNQSTRRQHRAHRGAGGQIGSIDPSHPSLVHFVL